MYLKIYLSDLPFVFHQWEGNGSPSAFYLSLPGLGLSGRVNGYELNASEWGVRQMDFSLAKVTVERVRGSSEHTVGKQKWLFMA